MSLMTMKYCRYARNCMKLVFYADMQILLASYQNQRKWLVSGMQEGL